MPKQKSVEITVMSTVIQSKKVYIGTLIRRNFDGRYLITNHTEDPGDAREFTTPERAADIRSLLVNHHNREYTIETVTVAASKAHPYQDEDELT